MEISQGLKSLFGESVPRQPARCFGQEEGHGEEDECQAHLHEVRTLPGDVAGQRKEESVIYPTRQCISSDQERVFDADHEATAVRCSDFGLDDRNGHGQEANGEALDGSAGDEAGEVRSKALDEGADEVDESADADTLLPPDYVSQSAGDQGSNCCGCLKTGHCDASDGWVDVSMLALHSTVL